MFIRIEKYRSRLLIATMAMIVGILASAEPSIAQTACQNLSTLTVPLPDPVSGRRYEIFVSFPAGYEQNPRKTYPLVILADGGRAFKNLSCDAHALARNGAIGEDPLVVGLSYAAGESLEDSRRRDYTPKSRDGGHPAYGGASEYQNYIRNVVLRHVETNYRTDPRRRIFWGHSYGGLLGAHILLTEPDLFQTYLLGSPSFWFAGRAIHDVEAVYAKRSRRLAATIFLYVGGLEVARYDAARKGNTRDMLAGMQAFEALLHARNYSGLHLQSTVISGKDHISSVRPGFAWALSQGLPPTNQN